MSILIRPRLWLAALRDRRHNEPAPTMRRLGHIETEIVSRLRTAIHARLERLSQRVEPWRAHLTNGERQIATLSEVFSQKVAEADGRTYQLLMIPAGFHWALLAGITVGELAFNAQAFGLLGEATWMTWLVALAIGLALPVVAALLGFELRSGYWTVRKLITWLGIGAGVVVALVFVNYVRAAYLLAVDTTDETLAGHFPGLSVAYLSMNVFIFVAAATVSYAGNDPVRGFVQARRRLLMAEQRIVTARWRIARERDLAAADAARHSEAGLNLLLFYRGANRRGRALVPGYFDECDHMDYSPRLVPDPNVAASAEEPRATTTVVSTNTAAADSH